MAVSLVKGGNVSLTKEAPSMNVALVGLGWDARVTDGQAFDLDASVFLVGENGKVLSDSHFVFYNNTTSPDGAVQHQGDNRTGEGDGDDEQVKIDLTKVATDVKKLVFAVTIHEADSRKQNFGMVSNSFMRVVNNDNGAEIARFDLSEDASTETAMIFGELYRHGAEWKFKAVGQGFAGGLAALATQHGINI
ncbi:tellurium resistance cAMP binding protein TerE [Klebsiella quasipneumoniae]|uniref:tellurium resistance cAMP binding protein TerE n=1 Tax=Klebsiella TaxID=570 RepID=UPI000D58D5D0|nr:MULTISPECIES: tellurium resistance cAMP binding protein TerE [Klebsiella]HBC8620132.1 tellurium resistance cAMP binding protein TerE [Klebsiella oxytoca]HBS3081839.1 tellurium resistance cAMP binding protein TerE [Klebsiella variicola subsp. variicola]EIW8794225.1 tellurium resistance cAMP binding protein TerE [Klebsiella pneumoniae]MBF1945963.1 tellurium resistance cAMP binding protein TerE [Klebsiella pneumoniae]MBG1971356.1 tellurium resistance cAMP binding protein TerE [Klebsiella pneum